MRRWWLIAPIVLVPLRSEARFNPLRVVTENQVRAEIVVVLDTSGSMASGVCPTCSAQCVDASGSDCLGDRAGLVDICGDGMCTGLENTSSCSTDCTLDDNASPATAGVAPAGQAPNCTAWMASHLPSRFAVAKRALRTVLPALRTVANFSLVTFKQTGYFAYRQASAAAPTKAASLFLSEWELKKYGAWDTVGDQPVASFAWPSTVGTGATMALTSSSTLAVAQDSLYRRTDDSAQEQRFAFSVAGKRYSSGGYDWEYVGSYYTYVQSAIDTGVAPRIESSYQGPQFTDTGVTWVYTRYRSSICDYQDQGIDGNDVLNARMVQSLTESQTQADQDVAIGTIMGHLSDVPNGGIMAQGGTPLGPALAMAKQQFEARRDGVSPFAAADAASSCRTRFVLAITDGTTFDGGDPATAATDLFNVDPSNPIKTFVIGLPASDMTKLDAIAAAGGTGTAFFANDEAALLQVLRDTLFSQLAGQFATSAPGSGTSAQSSLQGNVGLLVSTEYPSWRGHLTAVDVTTKCSGSTPPPNLPCTKGTCVDGVCQLWDAGSVLETADWRARQLYTGFNTSASGAPIALIAQDGSGTPCVTGGAAGGCHPTVGINDVWASATGSAAPADVGAAVEWLAGKGRAWKLPAIVNSVPATVGPPPDYQGLVPGHGELESRQAARQRLVYVASSEGLLHAFDIEDGREMYAYLPAHLLPKVYELYKQGGQDLDPSEFKWIMANSPRIDDLKDATGKWQTYLIQTDGPGGDQFAVLDVTDPSTCTDPLDSTTCSINSPPFSVVFSSQKAVPTITTTLGQTFSIPAMFWTTLQQPRVAMGSGYDESVANEGSYYNFFKTVAQPGWSTSNPADLDTQLLSGATAVVPDYAVLADAAAAYDPAGPRNVIATYQADLAGRITRFDRGGKATVATVIDSTEGAGPGHPFYFSPAVLFRADLNKVAVAAVSGAFQEEDYSWNPSFESKIFLRAEDAGSVDPLVDSVTCAVSNACSTTCFPAGVPSGCVAPAQNALPNSSPLLVTNAAQGDRLEAFYLLHEPPAAVCAGNTPAMGNAFILRIASEGAGTAQSLVQAKRYPSTYISGMTIVGGGSDLILLKSGRGGSRASIETFSGNPVTGSRLAGPPIIESWREVR